MKKRWIYFVALIVIFGITVIVYYYTHRVNIGLNKNLTERNIETFEKLLLNGYLGILFGFKYSGNINWLILPLFFIYCWVHYRCRNFPKYLRGFLLMILLSFGLIALKGYFNARYQYTMVPLFIFLVFLLVWKLFKYEDKKIFQWSVIILLLMSFSNFYIQALDKRFKEKFNMVFGKQSGKTILQNISSDEVLKHFENIVITDNIFEYINNMKTDKWFLVNNIPDFYYRTNKKGHYYWCGDDFLFTENGQKNLLNNLSLDSIQNILLYKYNCKYIYTYKYYFNYNNLFDKFIYERCKLLLMDKDNKMLFEIIEKEKSNEN